MTEYDDLRQHDKRRPTLNGDSFAGVRVSERTDTETYALSSARRGQETASRGLPMSDSRRKNYDE